ncbi:hypothetical protein KFK09_024243 [Dendrobium nobile]|uniref:Uncharacterized protein n=1 Tax=Dendrobium nobile TaxID=94219 RepID=A0A8T3AEB0_DENNO|nr:hypothetical protein KFK09_024243 [Dendrobium nobile]
MHSYPMSGALSEVHNAVTDSASLPGPSPKSVVTPMCGPPKEHRSWERIAITRALCCIRKPNPRNRQRQHMDAKDILGLPKSFPGTQEKKPRQQKEPQRKPDGISREA